MVGQNTAEKPVVETLEEKLARVEAENAELKKNNADKLAESKGEFKIAVTEARAAGTRNEKDKGSKGGSLNISVGQSHVYPSIPVMLAMLSHAKEIQAFITANTMKLSR